jgi:hypothetical protein
MKKYLWIAGGAALLISAFLGGRGVSHAQLPGDNKQSRRDPRRLDRSRRKLVKPQDAPQTRREDGKPGRNGKKDAVATSRLRSTNRLNHREAGAGKPRT